MFCRILKWNFLVKVKNEYCGFELLSRSSFRRYLQLDKLSSVLSGFNDPCGSLRQEITYLQTNNNNCLEIISHDMLSLYYLVHGTLNASRYCTGMIQVGFNSTLIGTIARVLCPCMKARLIHSSNFVRNLGRYHLNCDFA